MRREFTPISESFTIGLMAKFWESGRVKTRLGASIGMARAAQIHRIFVAYLCNAHADSGQQRSIALSPFERQRDVAVMLASLSTGTRWTIVDQGTGDLGERMMRWFSDTLIHPRSRAILIGADCPTLRPELMARAGELLQQQDVVVGPACDGGYYLIGLRGQWSEMGSRFARLFQDVPWSTPEVLDLTRMRLNESGLSCAELETGEDVDTIVELRRLLGRLGPEDSELKLAIEDVLIDPKLAQSP